MTFRARLNGGLTRPSLTLRSVRIGTCTSDCIRRPPLLGTLTRLGFVYECRCPPRPRNTRRRSGAQTHIRDHFASRRRQDDADRAIAAPGRRDPPRGPGEGPRRGPPCPLGLDEDRAGTRYFGHYGGHDLRIRERRVQSPRYARPRGFLRRHLPHADGSGFGGNGHRRRQGDRKPDPQIVRSLPAARHSDHDLHQQDGPRGARSFRIDRRDRRSASIGMRSAQLAGGIGSQFPRRLRPRTRGVRQICARRAAHRRSLGSIG